MTSSIRGLLLAAVLSLIAPLAAHAGLQALDQLFVFGDSLSDGGNYAGPGGPGTYPPSPYASTRYSNGPTAVEYLWQAYHPNDTSFKPSSLGGSNYALGGATSGSNNFNAINPQVPAALRQWFGSQGGVGSQVTTFANNCDGCFNPDQSLFVVWAFPNDAFYNSALAMAGMAALSPEALIAQGVANIKSAIQDLISEGATNFLIPNMPDLGNTPAFQGNNGLTGLTLAFNYALSGALVELDQTMNNSVDITLLDSFGTLNDVITNKDKYGMKNVTQQCVQHLGDAHNPCDPDSWLFWDGVHPTSAGHAILGAQFAAAIDVPEPASLWLMTLALVLLGWRWRAHQLRFGTQAAWRPKSLPALA